MNNLFNIQPAGFGDFMQVFGKLSAVYNHILQSKALDLAQEAKGARDGIAGRSTLVPHLFGGDIFARLKIPVPTARVVSDSLFDVFKAQNEMPSSGVRAQNLQQALGAGYGEAAETINLVKAAFSAALHSSNPYLEKVGIRMTKKAGMYNSQFSAYTTSQGAGVFLKKLSRFIEPEYMKETLWNFGAAQDAGINASHLMGYNSHINNAPDAMMSMSLAGADPAEYTAFIREVAASKARLQRLAPHYSRQPGMTPIQRARNIAAQFRNKMSYPVAANDRFTL